MNLKELQAMIKEELDSYMNEAEVDVDVDADDVDAGAEGGDNSEDMLRQIYDMLKGKFEAEEGGEEEAEDMDEDMMDEADMDEADMDEDMMDEAKKEEMDEAKKDEVDEAKHDDKDDVKEATHLQERFQKLANIIK